MVWVYDKYHFFLSDVLDYDQRINEDIYIIMQTNDYRLLKTAYAAIKSTKSPQLCPKPA